MFLLPPSPSHLGLQQPRMFRRIMQRARRARYHSPCKKKKKSLPSSLSDLLCFKKNNLYQLYHCKEILGNVENIIVLLSALSRVYEETKIKLMKLQEVHCLNHVLPVMLNIVTHMVISCGGHGYL